MVIALCLILAGALLLWITLTGRWANLQPGAGAA